MRIHLIAIGGAAMHNMAIALADLGHHVTGSDDEIFEPSKGRLAAKGLLPDSIGWNPDRITKDIDAVILGMHARIDNPELLKAQELGIQVFSYPEFLYDRSKDKTRVVIAGSHGKTTITSMVLHVLKDRNIHFDYLVGAQIEGFETMVQISDAPVIIIEGDEYLSSPIDRRPKFHWYRPHVALITGIAWDHINVFPTWENYVEQFKIFVESLEAESTLVYCTKDETLVGVAQGAQGDFKAVPYDTPEYRIESGRTYLIDSKGEMELNIFGEHNLQNLNGARHVCAALGVSKENFYTSISSFKGASRRLEEIGRNDDTVVYKDFAHSPSKLKATVNAVKQQWDERTLVACMELHTFSSLTKEFLQLYKGTMDVADKAIVFYKKETIEHKKLEPISEEEVKSAFGRDDLMVFTNSEELQGFLRAQSWGGVNLLMMSSGNFGGIKVEDLGAELLTPGRAV